MQNLQRPCEPEAIGINRPAKISHLSDFYEVAKIYESRLPKGSRGCVHVGNNMVREASGNRDVSMDALGGYIAMQGS